MKGFGGTSRELLRLSSPNAAANSVKDLAEREGFEPPVRFPVHLISSQAPSTGLGHLSVCLTFSQPQAREKIAEQSGRFLSQHAPGHRQLMV